MSLIYDLFCGTGSATEAWRAHGDEVITVDLNPAFSPSILADINELKELQDADFAWLSPDCSCYSTLSNWMHFTPGEHEAKTEKAKRSVETVRHAIELTKDIPGVVFENPRSLFRVVHGPSLFAAGFKRYTVTYCSYGDFRMKPTDLFIRGFPFTPLPLCRRILIPECQEVLYPHDHERARRGTNKGTMSLKRIDAGRIPPRLSQAIHAEACWTAPATKATSSDDA